MAVTTASKSTPSITRISRSAPATATTLPPNSPPPHPTPNTPPSKCHPSAAKDLLFKTKCHPERARVERSGTSASPRTPTMSPSPTLSKGVLPEIPVVRSEREPSLHSSFPTENVILSEARDQPRERSLRRDRVVPRTRLHLVIFFCLDLNFAVRPVALLVGGRVPDVVLAAQFVGDLVERRLQLVHLVPHLDHPPAGFVA